MAAKIWIDYDRKKIMLSAPFNERFNHLIRDIPRFFNKETKIWEFDVEFGDHLVDIALKVWKNVKRPPFLLMEIFEFLTEEDLKDMYSNLTRRHRNDEDKTLLTLLNRFFTDYINLATILKRKRMIRLETSNIPNIEAEINNLFFGTDPPSFRPGTRSDEDGIGSDRVNSRPRLIRSDDD